MAAPQQPAPPVQPRCTHYVSLTNGGIYPAMRSPAGYEDANPTEWRAATGVEVGLYKAGVYTTRPVIGPDVDLAEPVVAQPTAIRLAPEDPADPPPAPPEALQALGVPTLPTMPAIPLAP